MYLCIGGVVFPPWCIFLLISFIFEVNFPLKIPACLACVKGNKRKGLWLCQCLTQEDRSSGARRGDDRTSPRESVPKDGKHQAVLTQQLPSIGKSFCRASICPKLGELLCPSKNADSSLGPSPVSKYRFYYYSGMVEPTDQ